jgi:pimeloyl-ACP methyl ester carboxylesterase
MGLFARKTSGKIIPNRLRMLIHKGKKHMKGFRACCLGLLLLIVAIVSGCGSNTPTPTKQGFQSHFEKAACPFRPASGMTEGKDVTCGFLVVQEDRTNPQSKTIKLAVGIFKPVKTPAQPDPVIFLQGGPGGGGLQDFGPYMDRDLRGQFAPNRDLILIDQRGTGFSQPSLACPEEFKQSEDTADQNISRDQGVQLEVQVMQQCYNRLKQAGVNLDAYTTVNNAHDISELIPSLGYKEANIYGVSYGTRLALTVMHDFPQHVRSVILDSTVPTQLNLFTGLAKEYTRAFDVLFKGCASQLSCDLRYPNLKQTFYQLVDALNAKPITIQSKDLNNNKTYTVLVNGDALVGWLFSSLYATQLIPLLPKAITDLKNGDSTLLSQTYATLVYDPNFSQAMYYAVECGEDAAFTSLQETTTDAQGLPTEVQPVADESFQTIFDICKFWNAPAVPTDQKQPVASDIPTLFLVGEYDPITPPSNDQLAKQTLTHSYLYQFPGTGHGVIYTNDCPDGIMNAFLDNPKQAPDTSCIANMTEPLFL